MPTLVGDTRDRSRQGCQVGDPDINSDRATQPFQWLLDRAGGERVTDHERDLPTPAGVADRHLLDRRPAVFDKAEQATGRRDGVQPDELLHLSADVRILRLQQRLGKHQTHRVP